MAEIFLLACQVADGQSDDVHDEGAQETIIREADAEGPEHLRIIMILVDDVNKC